MADVVIYTRPFCGYCARAISLLDRKGVHYEEIEAGFDPKLRDEMVKRSGGRNTFPQIFIAGTHIGADDDGARAARPARPVAGGRLMLRVGLIQMRTPTDQAAALAQAEPLVRQAAANGARLIATPEGTNILQRLREALFEEDRDAGGRCRRPRPRRPGAGAGGLGADRLRAGEAADGKCANRAIIAPDGRITATYDKLHMFDVDLPTGERIREFLSYEPGDRAVVADAAGAKLGLTICYDVRFPALHNALAKAGAEVLTVPAAFTRPTGEKHWEILLRGTRHRDRLLRHRAGPGRDPRGRTRHLGPLDGCRAVGEVLALAGHAGRPAC